MTVKKKVSKSSNTKYEIEDIINRGDKTTGDSKQQKQLESEIRFTLRIPDKLIKKMDSDREARVGNVSRNQWILEAIAAKFE